MSDSWTLLNALLKTKLQSIMYLNNFKILSDKNELGKDLPSESNSLDLYPSDRPESGPITSTDFI